LCYNDKMNTRQCVSGLILLGAIFSVYTKTTFVNASTPPCRNIITPSNPFDPSSPLTTVAIINCDNPFGAVLGISPYRLIIEGREVGDGDVVSVSGGVVRSITHSADVTDNTLSVVSARLYRHVGDDYVFVNTEPSKPTQQDYLNALPVFFTTTASQSLYRAVVNEWFGDGNMNQYFSDPETHDETHDPETGELVQARLFSFFAFVENAYEPVLPAITTGTYTMVFQEDVLWNTQRKINTSDTMLARLKNWLLPTARAFDFPSTIYTVTFSITEVAPGVSSVIFFPGIMGSHLYEVSAECNWISNTPTERQRWFSRSDCYQRRLVTNVAGQSVNNIYTKPGREGVVERVLGIDLYGSFLDEMEGLVETGLIADFVPFPYDWRLELDDLLKTRLDVDTNQVWFDAATPLRESHLYKTVENISQTSYSGKVTLVAHSNGGLLVRAFMATLQATDEPLIEKIDNVVLIGSPQAGTPDAVTSMLHGSAIGYGIVVNQDTARWLLNTAPFGHHLLTSPQYFAREGAAVSTPVITFDEGEVTTPWREQFDPTITSWAQLASFLSRDSGRTKPSEADLKTPEVVDPFLLQYASTIAAVQQTWQPTANTKVYQIAGTGIETVSGITYFTDYECVRSGWLWFLCGEYRPKLGYRINHTFAGDETVVAPSALLLRESENVERWWVDLFRYADDHYVDIEHKNIMALEETQNFISNIILNTPHPDYEYKSNEAITPNIGDRLEIHLNSPLDMFILTPQGQVSSTTVDIPNATYRRYGKVQYISIPSGTTAAKLILEGYEAGSFTLNVQKRTNGMIIEEINYTAVPNSTSTVVTLGLDNIHSSTTLVIDYDGDGKNDGRVEARSTGPATVSLLEVIIEDPKEVAPAPKEVIQPRTRRSTSSFIKPTIPMPLVAGVATSAIMTEAEYLAELARLLRELQRLLELYKKAL